MPQPEIASVGGAKNLILGDIVVGEQYVLPAS